MISLSFNRKLVDLSAIEQTVPRTTDGKVDVQSPIPLKHSWVLWEQLQQSASQAQPEVALTGNASAQTASYTDLTTRVVTIGDVQTFWRYFVNLPQPSHILGESKKIVRQDTENGPTNTLAALMLFKDGIRPEWEDPVNSKGGHFQFNLQLERSRNTKETMLGSAMKEAASNSSWLTQTDEYWNNIVLGLIGGSLDPEDFVTGVRLVDKIKPPPKQGGKPVGHIRVEVWFRDISDTHKVSALKESLETHMRCRIDGTVSNETSGMFPGYKLDMRSHSSSEAGHDIAPAVTDKLKNPKRNPTSGGGRKAGAPKVNIDQPEQTTSH
jgi:translation initiation factor 4E